MAADARCNAAKKDYLAAAPFVDRWRRRMEGAAVEEAVQEAGWHRTLGTTLGVARAIYLRLPESVLLWSGGNEFVPADRSALSVALA